MKNLKPLSINFNEKNKLVVEAAFASFVFFIACSLFLKPIVSAPHDGIPGDYGDVRLIITLLEHSYSFIFQSWPDTFWSPSWLFYPFSNGLALSETMAGNVPFYAIFRLIGFDPFSSYQFWFVFVCILNFASAWLLARELGGTAISAAIVAFLFTFAMPRFAQFNHTQLLPHYFSVISIWALIKFFKSSDKPMRFLYIATISAAWQFWASVYFGLFLLLVYLGLTISALAYKPIRRLVIPKLLDHKLGLLIAATLAIVILAPLFYRYHLIKEVTGYRDWPTVFWGMADWKQLILPIHDSFLYQGFHKYMMANSTIRGMEPYLFSGFLPLAAPFILMTMLLFSRIRRGYLTRVEQYAVYFSLSYIFLLLLASKTSPKEFNLYYYIYQYVPGFGALRQLNRIHLLYLLFLGLSLQFIVAKVYCKNRLVAHVLGLLMLVAVFLENIPTNFYIFSKSQNNIRIEKLTSLVLKSVSENGCKAFFLSTPNIDYATHNDAMWISLQTKIPTINGYSGHNPPGWNLYRARHITKEHIMQYLYSYGSNWDQADICLIHAGKQDLL
ncbi:MAG: hypothetical protein ACOH5I_06130 [Oligoflexus sp.]